VTLLVLLVGSFVVSIGIAAIGVAFQDRMEKIAGDSRVGKSLRWLFLFPVLDRIEKFLTEHLRSGFRKASSIAAAIMAIVLLLSLIALLIYMLTNHLKLTLLAAAVLVAAIVFVARRP
jgi:hypothetical protein